MEFKKIGLLLMCFWWIHTAQAQKDNFCADYKFICKGGIDEKGIGLEGNDPSFCYKWDNPTLLNSPNSGNPKIKVALNEKTVFNVTVTTPDGDKYEDKITVLVYSLDLEISLPKIDGGAVVAEADEQTIGSQTFINIDNDDEDATPDLNDNLVLGGDNELMKLKGKITFYPNIEFALKNSNTGTDLGSGAERSLPKLADFGLLLKATKGDKNVALWKFDTKEIPIAKNNGSYAFLKADLIFDPLTNEFFFERWIEGIEGNDITRGTELELALDDSANSALAPAAACAKDIVACTIVEITSVKWLGIGNGACNDEALTSKNTTFEGDFLDADTQYGATNSVRVFPDGRITGGVVGASKNKVRIEVKTKCAMAIDAKIYLRAFDMDDPSQNVSDTGKINRPDGKLILDPNDDNIVGTYEGGKSLKYDKQNDNRGLVNLKKFGNAIGMNDKGIWNFTMPKNDSTKTGSATFNALLFQVSEYAGDNYALFAASDSKFLDSLENYDFKDVSKIMFVNGSLRSLPINKGVQSDILTVWRLLHLEYDSMKNFTWGSDRSGNYEGFFNISNFIENATTSYGRSDSTKYSKINMFLNNNEYDDDLDVNYINSNKAKQGNGKYAKGAIYFNGNQIVLPGGITNPINGHDKENIFFDYSMNLIPTPTSMWLKNNAGTIVKKVNLNKIIEAPKDTFHWHTLPPLTISDVGNELGYSQSSKIIDKGVNPYGNFVTNKLEFSGFSIRDDDSNTLLPKNTGNLEVLDEVLQKSYIQLIEDAGGIGKNDANIDFTPNINSNFFINNTSPGFITLMDIINKIDNKNTVKVNKKDNFWSCHLLSAFQSDFDEDNDPAAKSGTYMTLGKSYPFSNVLSHTEVANGCYSSFIYLETIRDRNETPAKFIIAHEVGHQFGLSHGGGEKILGKDINEYPQMGIMKGVDISGNFIPRHLNLIRSRINSPGHN